MSSSKGKARTTAANLPDSVRLALRRYFPTEVSAHSAAYYALPEHLALLRLRSEAEGRMLRWNDAAEELKKDLEDLAIRMRECTSFNNAYELEILLHEGIPFPDKREELFELIKRGPVRTAYVAASFLAPYWTIQFRHWKCSRAGVISMLNVPQEGRHSTRVANSSAKILKKFGWRRIPSNLAQTKIQGIDLQHLPQGEVRVADVVFGDFNTPVPFPISL
jgi:hypothetical protein